MDKSRIIPPSEQPTDQLYDMSLRFKCDAAPTGINDFMQQCGFSEQLAVQDAVMLYVKQQASFIPDDAAIQRYIEVLQEAQDKNPGEVKVQNIRFDGYDYIYMVEKHE